MLSRVIQRSIGSYQPRIINRGFQVSATVLNTNTSLFGSITQGVKDNADDPTKISNRLTVASSLAEKSEGEHEDVKESVTVENDTMLQTFITKNQQPVKSASSLFLSPLKRKIYEENCRVNGGFYKKDTIVFMPQKDGKSLKYKLNLTREEIEALEPSVYVKSYRIKSSMKKATQLLRLINGLEVKTALSQCHFSDKKIAHDVAELLQRGLEDGKKLGLKEDDLYIAQIWTGSDGWWQKRIDIKARGRNGVITHPYVHVRCILKTKSITKNRLAYEAQLKQERKKPWVQLGDKPVRGTMGGAYKW